MRLRRSIPPSGGTARPSHVFALVLTLALVPITACDTPEPMPLELAATWLVESPPVAAGNPFEMVLFVRTPAGHRVHAYALPDVEAIDVVERRILPMSAEGRLAVHREALIARARAPGTLRWPASEVLVSDEAGETYAIALDGLALDVPSVFDEGVPPRRPRGYRDAPAAPQSRSFGLGVVAGAAAMGALALLLLRRDRRRRGGAVHAPPGSAGAARQYIGGSGRLARRLEAARETCADDDGDAAAQATLALRHWAADRFLVSTHARSSEELRRTRPERADESEWASWLDRLADVERARFGRLDRAERSAALERAIESAIAFAHAIDRPDRRADERADAHPNERDEGR